MEKLSFSFFFCQLKTRIRPSVESRTDSIPTVDQEYIQLSAVDTHTCNDACARMRRNWSLSVGQLLLRLMGLTSLAHVIGLAG